jgi:hypothetical protein
MAETHTHPQQEERAALGQWATECHWRGCDAVLDMRRHYYCDRHQAVYDRIMEGQRQRLMEAAEARRELALAAKYGKNWGAWS